MQTEYRSVFISDVHLGFRGARTAELAAFLKMVRCENLYLVGDIVDMWALRGRWNWPTCHNKVVRRVLKMAQRGTRVTYIPGNHDDAARPYAGLEFGGVRIQLQCVHTLLDGRQVLVTHGDEFDLVVQYSRLVAMAGSRAYDQLVALNRRVNAVRRFIGLPRWSFSQSVKKRVKGACTFISRYEEALLAEARRRGLDGVICGHIHEPRLQCTDMLYANCGDWIERSTALIEHLDGTLEILDVEALLHQLGCDVAAAEPMEVLHAA